MPNRAWQLGVGVGVGIEHPEGVASGKLPEGLWTKSEMSIFPVERGKIEAVDFA